MKKVMKVAVCIAFMLTVTGVSGVKPPVKNDNTPALCCRGWAWCWM